MDRIQPTAFLVTLPALLACLPLDCSAQNKAAPPQPEEIIHKVAEREKWKESQKIEAKYTYTSLDVAEILNKDGSLKERREKLYQVIPIEGEPYYKLIQKNGKPLSPEEAKEEEEHQKKFRQKLAEEKGKKTHDEDDVELNEALFSKYRYTLAGEEEINGRPAYVLAFAPKSDDLPVKRRLDRLLNKVSGKLWVDERESELVKAEVHLTQPVTLLFGILASLRRFDGTLEQMKIDDGVWLPSRFGGYFEGRIGFKTLHQRGSEQFSNFALVPQPVHEASAGSH